MSAAKFIAIVCGLRSEARIIEKCAGATEKLRIGVSGANAARANEIAAKFCTDGAAAIISAGISGGLDPALCAGDVVIGKKIVTVSGREFACDVDAVLTAYANDARAAPRTHTLFGSDEIISSCAEKARIFKRCQAAAVDMESHGAAQAAGEAGVAFIAVRAIADNAALALPKAALNAVAPDGSTRTGRVLLNCLKAPGQFPALIRLGAASDKALKALGRDFGAILGGLFLRFEL